MYENMRQSSCYTDTLHIWSFIGTYSHYHRKYNLSYHKSEYTISSIIVFRAIFFKIPTDKYCKQKFPLHVLILLKKTHNSSWYQKKFAKNIFSVKSRHWVFRPPVGRSRDERSGVWDWKTPLTSWQLPPFLQPEISEDIKK